MLQSTSRDARARRARRLGALLVFILALKVVLLIAFALNTRFVMDEFIHFGQSLHVFNGMYSEKWPAKTVGYAIAYLPSHWLGWDAVSTLLIGRLEAAFLALATVAMIYVAARRLGQSRMRALVIVIVLLSFSTFIERSFRVRSEPVALLFATAALLVMLGEGEQRLRRIFLAGLLSGLAFTCTQKSVYFNFSLGVAIVTNGLARRQFSRATLDGAILLGGWAAVVAAYCVAFGGADALSVARDVFVGPTYVALHAHEYYEGIEAFIAQTLRRNPLLYLTCFLGLTLAIVRYDSLTPQQRIAAVFTLVLAVLVFRHNQPWPYVFTMVLPFLALWALVPYDVFAHRPGAQVAFQAAAVAALMLGFGRNVIYLQHDNRLELAVVRQSERLLSPEQTYFDGNGMIPTRRDHPRIFLDAPTIARVLKEGEASQMMGALRTAPPDLIITSYRTDNLAPVLKPFTDHSYVEVAPHIMIPGTEIRPGRAELFVAPLAGDYDLFLDGVPVGSLAARINGAIVNFPVRLDRGRHEIEIPDGKETYRVLPAGTPLLPPPITLSRPLFADVYSF